MITALALRDYQQQCLTAIDEGERHGIRRGLVALPTGTGKTVIFAQLIWQRGARTLVLVHRDELVRQTVDKVLTVDPSADIGVVKAERDEHDRPIVLASVQTLSRAQRLERLVADFDLVIVDEAHHANADTYIRILDHVGSFEADGPLTVGFTATPERADGKPLADVWQQIVYRSDLLTMIRAGYLADLRATQIRLNVDLRNVRNRMGDYAPGELAEAMTRADAPQHTVEAYRDYAADRSALVFTAGVALAHETAALFREAGIAAEALDGTTDLSLRRAMLERLASGETRVIVNCGVLTEGFDCPRVDCIVVARPTKSKPLYVQMIGRGTRLYPGKSDLLILDLVGATIRHDLMTAATLFGLPATELAKESVVEIVERRERQQREAAEAGRLVAETVDVFARQRLHWIGVSGGRFSLATGTGQIVLVPVTSTRDRWRIIELVRGGGSTIHGDDLALPWAQGRAEDLIRERGAGALVNPHAAWRQAAASPKQLAALRWRRIRPRPGLTAGEASDLMVAHDAAGAVAS